ncbi:MAG: hypothetical protein M1300_03975 [Epsilonproteobacteria bacterium]|nr:hypothetical protein [Campylobacterota bacterium]
MDDINTLSLKIDKLERDHKAYIEFGAGCFIGILAIGMMIDHHYDPFLWLVLFVLFVSLVSSIVIGVKKSLEKDRYIQELKSLSIQV